MSPWCIYSICIANIRPSPIDISPQLRSASPRAHISGFRSYVCHAPRSYGIYITYTCSFLLIKRGTHIDIMGHAYNCDTKAKS